MKKQEDKQSVRGIKTLTGHLTATDKTHLITLLNLGMSEAKVNRKNFFLKDEGNNTYSVKIVENQYSESHQKVMPVAYNHSFKAKRCLAKKN